MFNRTGFDQAGFDQAGFNQAGTAFFTVLAEAVEAFLGPDHACTQAVRRAARDATPQNTHRAQDALAALEPGLVQDIMAQTHKKLRENPVLLLADPPADPQTKPH